MRKKYVRPVLTIELLEDDDLMINVSYTSTTSYLEDDPENSDDYIIIHPDPIDPGDMDDDDDY